MYTLIESYMEKLTLPKIYEIATKNEITLTEEEALFIKNFLQNNWRELLKNPSKLQDPIIKSHLQESTYIKIIKLVNLYKRYIP